MRRVLRYPFRSTQGLGRFSTKKFDKDKKKWQACDNPEARPWPDPDVFAKARAGARALGRSDLAEKVDEVEREQQANVRHDALNAVGQAVEPARQGRPSADLFFGSPGLGARRRRAPRACAHPEGSPKKTRLAETFPAPHPPDPIEPPSGVRRSARAEKVAKNRSALRPQWDAASPKPSWTGGGPERPTTTCIMTGCVKLHDLEGSYGWIFPAGTDVFLTKFRRVPTANARGARSDREGGRRKGLG